MDSTFVDWPRGCSGIQKSTKVSDIEIGFNGGIAVDQNGTIIQSEYDIKNNLIEDFIAIDIAKGMDRNLAIDNDGLVYSWRTDTISKNKRLSIIPKEILKKRAIKVICTNNYNIVIDEDYVVYAWPAFIHFDEKIEINMVKKPGGTYEIPCEVNGLSLSFVFDTGASDVTLSAVEADFMYRHGYLKESDNTGTQQYRIANGDIVEGTTIKIRELKIGIVLKNVDAAISHTTNVLLYFLDNLLLVDLALYK